jgi:hypothetical protein
MTSPKLDQYFKDTNPDNLKSRLASILCYPEYAQAFNDYRESILNTLEN